jgi:hypothetical protein
MLGGRVGGEGLPSHPWLGAPRIVANYRPGVPLLVSEHVSAPRGGDQLCLVRPALPFGLLCIAAVRRLIPQG